MNRKKLLSLLVITLSVALGVVAVLTVTGVLAFNGPLGPPASFVEPANETDTGKLQEIVGTSNATATGTDTLFNYLRQIDTKEGGTPTAVAEDQTDAGKLQDLLGASATAADGKTVFNYLKKIDDNLSSGGGLPGSGVSKCYNTAGDEISCGGTDWPNQDGDHYLALSYTDNGCGTETVKDNITGLCWQKDGSIADVKNWQLALQYCDGLDLGGHTDWRLPNIKELQSIVNYQNVSPSIDSTYFPSAASGYYWSSTSSAGYPGFAWLVYFGLGYVYDDYKSGDYYVRCVR